MTAPLSVDTVLVERACTLFDEAAEGFAGIDATGVGGLAPADLEGSAVAGAVGEAGVAAEDVLALLSRRSLGLGAAARSGMRCVENADEGFAGALDRAVR